MLILFFLGICAALSAQDYKLKLAEIDHQLDVLSKMRAYGRKYFVGEHKTDSISSTNMEEIVKAISRANDQAKEIMVKQQKQQSNQ